jgi:hypothetical protein
VRFKHAQIVRLDILEYDFVMIGVPKIEELQKQIDIVSEKNGWSDYSMLVLDNGQIHFEIDRGGQREEIRFDSHRKFAEFIDGLFEVAKK